MLDIYRLNLSSMCSSLALGYIFRVKVKTGEIVSEDEQQHPFENNGDGQKEATLGALDNWSLFKELRYDLMAYELRNFSIDK